MLIIIGMTHFAPLHLNWQMATSSALTERPKRQCCRCQSLRNNRRNNQHLIIITILWLDIQLHNRLNQNNYCLQTSGVPVVITNATVFNWYLGALKIVKLVRNKRRRRRSRRHAINFPIHVRDWWAFSSSSSSNTQLLCLIVNHLLLWWWQLVKIDSLWHFISCANPNLSLLHLM